MKVATFILIIAIAIGVNTAYSQETWYIDINGSDSSGDGSLINPFGTIQYGINISSTGDSIVVMPGTYYEQLDVEKSLSLLSSSGKDSTIIDAQGTIDDTSSSVLTILSAGNVSINGFTIKNGRGFTTGNPITSAGGGIYSIGTALEIIDCNITENEILTNDEVIGGGGIFTDESSSFSISNSIIIGNSVSEYWSGGTIVAGSMKGGGGILALCDSVAISSCTISNNYAYSDFNPVSGGGIHLKSSFCIISDCIIENNRADGSNIGSDLPDSKCGGGIYLNGDNNFLSNCSLSNNFSTFTGGYYSQPLAGGGVYLIGDSLSITDNEILDNGCIIPALIEFGDSTGFRLDIGQFTGGGLYVNGYDNSVSGNTISGNRCSWYDLMASTCSGGGMFFDGSGEITKNLFSANACSSIADWPSAIAFSTGGGLYASGDIKLINNTFDLNLVYSNLLSDETSAIARGGAIYSYGNVEILNNIISSSTAIAVSNQYPEYDGGGIYTDDIDNISYNNFYNSLPNDVNGDWIPNIRGNIYGNPVFSGDESFSYTLSENSPCIDGGYPLSDYEADGTQADIGAFYFEHTPPDLYIDIIPYNEPIAVPAGSSFTYRGIVTNTFIFSMVREIGFKVILPDNSTYILPSKYNVFIRVGERHDFPIVVQKVPAAAAVGNYTYIAFVIDNLGSTIDSSYFYFSIIENPENSETGADDWALKGWNDNIASEPIVDYHLLGNHPNPFNNFTTISYQLPEQSDVELNIYNLMGQLIDSYRFFNQSEGEKSITWDASAHSSGVYYYRLKAGDKEFSSRMTLIK
ncbi:MAG: T9SS type A sorting domain-containing protein [candidate division Zixibacteria bacterium]|nr:T9SS type A sorting domain-containing protein [candidate division Zixibacteria bacterium]